MHPKYHPESLSVTTSSPRARAAGSTLGSTPQPSFVKQQDRDTFHLNALGAQLTHQRCWTGADLSQSPNFEA